MGNINSNQKDIKLTIYELVGKKMYDYNDRFGGQYSLAKNGTVALSEAFESLNIDQSVTYDIEDISFKIAKKIMENYAKLAEDRSRKFKAEYEKPTKKQVEDFIFGEARSGGVMTKFTFFMLKYVDIVLKTFLNKGIIEQYYSIELERLHERSMDFLFMDEMFQIVPDKEWIESLVSKSKLVTKSADLKQNALEDEKLHAIQEASALEAQKLGQEALKQSKRDTASPSKAQANKNEPNLIISSLVAKKDDKQELRPRSWAMDPLFKSEEDELIQRTKAAFRDDSIALEDYQAALDRQDFEDRQKAVFDGYEALRPEFEMARNFVASVSNSKTTTTHNR